MIKINAYRGDTFLNLTTEFRGWPLTTVKWYKENQELTNNGNYVMLVEDSVAKLTLNKVSKLDEGTYTVVAASPCGEALLCTELCVDDVIDERNSNGKTHVIAPILLQPLTDQMIRVGKKSRFAVAASQPEVQIQWYKDKEKLHENEKYQVAHQGGVSTLDINMVEPSDEGVWRCEVITSFGYAITLAKLQTIVPKGYRKPEFLEPLKALLTEQGTVAMQCKVVGVPTPLLRWFKDGNEIKAGDMFNLRLNDMDESSLGTYMCLAINCMGKAVSSAQVTVTDKLDDKYRSKLKIEEPIPHFYENLEDKTIRVGDHLRLTVRVKTPPAVQVAWHRNNEPIEASDKFHPTQVDDGIFHLDVTPIEFDDNGQWSCTATNQYGHNSLKCNIELLIPKQYRSPEFVEDLLAIFTDDGLVSFECKVIGVPTPILRWYKDGTELKPGDVHQLSGSNSLGRYSCVAKNCMGSASSYSELTLEDIYGAKERRKPPSKQPPRFIQPLKDELICLGTPYKFTIIVTCPPVPEVTWYKDNQRVDSIMRYQIRRERNGVYHLNIEAAELVDQGIWKCLIVNDYGHSLTQACLRVTVPKHFKKPMFIDNLRAVLSEEGAVSLQCKVVGVPQPTLTWFKDGAELKAGDIYKIVSGEGGTSCLGTYTCEAKNCMGMSSSTAALLAFDDKHLGEQYKDNFQQELSTIEEKDEFSTYGTPSITDNWDEYKTDMEFSIYDTPDITENEARQIIELFANEASEYVSIREAPDLPPLRFIKESAMVGNIVMEALIIDVPMEHFSCAEDMSQVNNMENLATEADIAEISTYEPVIVDLPYDYSDAPSLHELKIDISEGVAMNNIGPGLQEAIVVEMQTPISDVKSGTKQPIIEMAVATEESASALQPIIITGACKDGQLYASAMQSMDDNAQQAKEVQESAGLEDPEKVELQVSPNVQQIPLQYHKETRSELEPHNTCEEAPPAVTGEQYFSDEFPPSENLGTEADVDSIASMEEFAADYVNGYADDESDVADLDVDVDDDQVNAPDIQIGEEQSGRFTPTYESAVDDLNDQNNQFLNINEMEYYAASITPVPQEPLDDEHLLELAYQENGISNLLLTTEEHQEKRASPGLLAELAGSVLQKAADSIMTGAVLAESLVAMAANLVLLPEDQPGPSSTGFIVEDNINNFQNNNASQPPTLAMEEDKTALKTNISDLELKNLSAIKIDNLKEIKGVLELEFMEFHDYEQVPVQFDYSDSANDVQNGLDIDTNVKAKSEVNDNKIEDEKTKSLDKTLSAIEDMSLCIAKDTITTALLNLKNEISTQENIIKSLHDEPISASSDISSLTDDHEHIKISKKSQKITEVIQEEIRKGSIPTSTAVAEQMAEQMVSSFIEDVVVLAAKKINSDLKEQPPNFNMASEQTYRFDDNAIFNLSEKLDGSVSQQSDNIKTTEVKLSAKVPVKIITEVDDCMATSKLQEIRNPSLEKMADKIVATIISQAVEATQHAEIVTCNSELLGNSNVDISAINDSQMHQEVIVDTNSKQLPIVSISSSAEITDNDINQIITNADEATKDVNYLEIEKQSSESGKAPEENIGLENSLLVQEENIGLENSLLVQEENMGLGTSLIVQEENMGLGTSLNDQAETIDEHELPNKDTYEVENCQLTLDNGSNIELQSEVTLKTSNVIMDNDLMKSQQPQSTLYAASCHLADELVAKCILDAFESLEEILALMHKVNTNELPTKSNVSLEMNEKEESATEDHIKITSIIDVGSTIATESFTAKLLDNNENTTENEKIENATLKMATSSHLEELEKATIGDVHDTAYSNKNVNISNDSTLETNAIKTNSANSNDEVVTRESVSANVASDMTASNANGIIATNIDGIEKEFDNIVQLKDANLNAEQNNQGLESIDHKNSEIPLDESNLPIDIPKSEGSKEAKLRRSSRKEKRRRSSKKSDDGEKSFRQDSRDSSAGDLTSDDGESLSSCSDAVRTSPKKYTRTTSGTDLGRIHETDEFGLDVDRRRSLPNIKEACSTDIAALSDFDQEMDSDIIVTTDSVTNIAHDEDILPNVNSNGDLTKKNFNNSLALDLEQFTNPDSNISNNTASEGQLGNPNRQLQQSSNTKVINRTLIFNEEKENTSENHLGLNVEGPLVPKPKETENSLTMNEKLILTKNEMDNNYSIEKMEMAEHPIVGITNNLIDRDVGIKQQNKTCDCEAEAEEKCKTTTIALQDMQEVQVSRPTMADDGLKQTTTSVLEHLKYIKLKEIEAQQLIMTTVTEPSTAEVTQQSTVDDAVKKTPTTIPEPTKPEILESIANDAQQFEMAATVLFAAEMAEQPISYDVLKETAMAIKEPLNTQNVEYLNDAQQFRMATVPEPFNDEVSNQSIIDDPSKSNTMTVITEPLKTVTLESTNDPQLLCVMTAPELLMADVIPKPTKIEIVELVAIDAQQLSITDTVEPLIEVSKQLIAHDAMKQTPIIVVPEPFKTKILESINHVEELSMTTVPQPFIAEVTEQPIVDDVLKQAITTNQEPIKTEIMESTNDAEQLCIATVPEPFIAEPSIAHEALNRIATETLEPLKTVVAEQVNMTTTPEPLIADVSELMADDDLEQTITTIPEPIKIEMVEVVAIGAQQLSITATVEPSTEVLKQPIAHDAMKQTPIAVPEPLKTEILETINHVEQLSITTAVQPLTAEESEQQIAHAAVKQTPMVVPELLKTEISQSTNDAEQLCKATVPEPFIAESNAHHALNQIANETLKYLQTEILESIVDAEQLNWTTAPQPLIAAVTKQPMANALKQAVTTVNTQPLKTAILESTNDAQFLSLTAAPEPLIADVSEQPMAEVQTDTVIVEPLKTEILEFISDTEQLSMATVPEPLIAEVTKQPMADDALKQAITTNITEPFKTAISELTNDAELRMKTAPESLTAEVSQLLIADNVLKQTASITPEPLRTEIVKFTIDAVQLNISTAQELLAAEVSDHPMPDDSLKPNTTTITEPLKTAILESTNDAQLLNQMTAQEIVVVDVTEQPMAGDVLNQIISTKPEPENFEIGTIKAQQLSTTATGEPSTDEVSDLQTANDSLQQIVSNQEHLKSQILESITSDVKQLTMVTVQEPSAAENSIQPMVEDVLKYVTILEPTKTEFSELITIDAQQVSMASTSKQLNIEVSKQSVPNNVSNESITTAPEPSTTEVFHSMKSNVQHSCTTQQPLTTEVDMMADVQQQPVAFDDNTGTTNIQEQYKPSHGLKMPTDNTSDQSPHDVKRETNNSDDSNHRLSISSAILSPDEKLLNVNEQIKSINDKTTTISIVDEKLINTENSIARTISNKITTEAVETNEEKQLQVGYPTLPINQKIKIGVALEIICSEDSFEYLEEMTNTAIDSQIANEVVENLNIKIAAINPEDLANYATPVITNIMHNPTETFQITKNTHENELHNFSEILQEQNGAKNNIDVMNPEINQNGMTYLENKNDGKDDNLFNKTNELHTNQKSLTEEKFETANDIKVDICKEMASEIIHENTQETYEEIIANICQNNDKDINQNEPKPVNTEKLADNINQMVTIGNSSTEKLCDTTPDATTSISIINNETADNMKTVILLNQEIEEHVLAETADSTIIAFENEDKFNPDDDSTTKVEKVEEINEDNLAATIKSLNDESLQSKHWVDAVSKEKQHTEKEKKMTQVDSELKIKTEEDCVEINNENIININEDTITSQVDKNIIQKDENAEDLKGQTESSIETTKKPSGENENNPKEAIKSKTKKVVKKKLKSIDKIEKSEATVCEEKQSATSPINGTQSPSDDSTRQVEQMVENKFIISNEIADERQAKSDNKTNKVTDTLQDDPLDAIKKKFSQLSIEEIHSGDLLSEDSSNQTALVTEPVLEVSNTNGGAKPKPRNPLNIEEVFTDDATLEMYTKNVRRISRLRTINEVHEISDDTEGENIIISALTPTWVETESDQSSEMHSTNTSSSTSHSIIKHRIERPSKSSISKDRNTPQFIMKLKDLTIPANYRMRLTCCVIGTPEPHVNWLKNGIPVDSSMGYREINDLGICVLEIPRSSLEDAAEYTCIASNEHGETSTTGTLTVKDKTRHVEIDPTPTKPVIDAKGKRGDSITMDCSVTGRPAPNVTWLKDEEVIKPSDRVTTREYRSSGAHRLVIDNVTVEDSGVYKCVATNSVGRDEVVASVKVSGKREAEYSRRVSRPLFFTKPHNRVVQEGESVKFSCSLSGHPPPRIEWEKDGYSLTPSSRIQLIDKADIHSLIITNILPNDAGQYKITASNSAGKTLTTVKLDVVAKSRGTISTIRECNTYVSSSTSYRRSSALTRCYQITGFNVPQVLYPSSSSSSTPNRFRYNTPR